MAHQIPTISLNEKDKAYCNQLFLVADQDKDGFINSNDAVAFFKGIPHMSKIWELVNENNKLNENAFIVALKLIALSQSGKEPSLELLSRTEDLPFPKFHWIEPSPNPAPSVGTVPLYALQSSPGVLQTTPNSFKSTIPAVTGGPWVITPEARLKYENYFNQVDSARKGIIVGNIARNLFAASGLPSNDLSAIWNLADLNQDGNLDKVEWCIAMHLIDCKRQRLEIPSVLPKQLLESLGIQVGPSPAELARIKEEQERQQLLAFKEEIIKKLKDKSQLIVQLRQLQTNNLEIAKNASIIKQQNQKLKFLLPQMEIIQERQSIRLEIKTTDLKGLQYRLQSIQAEKENLFKTIESKKIQIKDDEAGLALAKQQLMEERIIAEKEAEKIAYLQQEIILAKQDTERKREERKRKEKEGAKHKERSAPDQYYILYADDYGTKIADKSNFPLFFSAYDKFFPPGFYPPCNDFSDTFNLTPPIIINERLNVSLQNTPAETPDFNPFSFDEE